MMDTGAYFDNSSLFPQTMHSIGQFPTIESQWNYIFMKQPMTSASNQPPHSLNATGSFSQEQLNAGPSGYNYPLGFTATAQLMPAAASIMNSNATNINGESPSAPNLLTNRPSKRREIGSSIKRKKLTEMKEFLIQSLKDLEKEEIDEYSSDSEESRSCNNNISK